MKTNFYQLTDKGQYRPKNEDYCGYAHDLKSGSVYIVCDGMGGHASGEKASKLTVESIVDYLEDSSLTGSQALEEALHYANSEVYNASLNDPLLKGMGTTAVVLLIKDDLCHIAHVGDSRIYLFSGSRLYRLTKDHTFVQMLVDQGVITQKETESHPRRNELLRALGIKPILEPTISQAPVMPIEGDIFLLCSDGLTSMLTDTLIASVLKDKKSSLQEKAAQLVDLANAAGGYDNITLQLVEILESPHSKPAFSPVVFDTGEDPKDRTQEQSGRGFIHESAVPPETSETISSSDTPETLRPWWKNPKTILTAGLLLVVLLGAIILIFRMSSTEDDAFLPLDSSSEPVKQIRSDSVSDISAVSVEHSADADSLAAARKAQEELKRLQAQRERREAERREKIAQVQKERQVQVNLLTDKKKQLATLKQRRAEYQTIIAEFHATKKGQKTGTFDEKLKATEKEITTVEADILRIEKEIRRLDGLIRQLENQIVE